MTKTYAVQLKDSDAATIGDLRVFLARYSPDPDHFSREELAFFDLLDRIESAHPEIMYADLDLPPLPAESPYCFEPFDSALGDETDADAGSDAALSNETIRAEGLSSIVERYRLDGNLAYLVISAYGAGMDKIRAKSREIPTRIERPTDDGGPLGRDPNWSAEPGDATDTDWSALANACAGLVKQLEALRAALVSKP